MLLDCTLCTAQYTNINIIKLSVLAMSVRLPGEFWNDRRSQWWGLFLSVYHSEPAVLFVQTKTPGMSGPRIRKRPKKILLRIANCRSELGWNANQPSSTPDINIKQKLQSQPSHNIKFNRQFQHRTWHMRSYSERVRNDKTIMAVISW